MDNPRRAPARVLVVDDNEANRALVREILEDEGHCVEAAVDGEDALQKFAEVAPDCVLLDIRMPGLDGFATCERLRALPGGEDVPILFLTAQRDIDNFDRAAAAGGDDFLTKPVRAAELITRVQSTLKLRRLGQEARGHAEELHRQRLAVQRLQLQRERLAAFVVHDLKNPVFAIDLAVQMLLAQADLAPERRAVLQRIANESQSLYRLIQNLLDMSQDNEGRLSPRVGEVDLAAMAHEIVATMSPLAASRATRIATDVEPVVLDADPELMRRMLTNLVDNAIRHAPRDSVVTIVARDGVDGVELQVRDQGPGVPPTMRETIFDPFVQITEGAQILASRSGRGLGLAFCRLVARAHGGEIWVEEADPGAAFCARLPRQP